MKLTDEEREEAKEAALVLEAAIEQYNEKASEANGELQSATELALLPLSTNFVFLAAVCVLLKKLFMLKSGG